MHQDTMSLYYDNTNAINISKNLVQRSRTKHFDIRHHFIRELVEEGTIMLKYIPIERQLADIVTKPLEAANFESLRKSIDVCN